MLSENYSCPKCARECCLTEAISVSRLPGALQESCVIKCPKCGTEFEIIAKQRSTGSEEKPAEEAPPEDKPAEEAPPPAKPSEEEEKKESAISAYTCLKCSREWLGIPGRGLCECGSKKIEESAASERLDECRKMVESGVNPDKALSILLGE